MGPRSGPFTRRFAGEAGVSTVVSVIALATVLAATTASATLLYRTMDSAQKINDKAANIAATGRGINTATDAVVQLSRTDEIAGSILNTAEPLEGKLGQIVSLAQEIDELAASIDGTAGDINQVAGAIDSTAGTINSTAGSINAEAAAILDVAGRIDFDVEQINLNLDDTIAVARAIAGDTGDILGQARAAHQNATCIDRKVGGARGTDGHC